MRYLQEITDWDTPNHTYYLNDNKSKMVGYIKVGTNTLVKFTTPISFDMRGRRFVELKNIEVENDEVYFGQKEKENKPLNVIEVQGSNGKIYFLSKNLNGKYTCTCPGFTFRNKCKHIEQA
jgi:hypothetical protein